MRCQRCESVHDGGTSCGSNGQVEEERLLVASRGKLGVPVFLRGAAQEFWGCGLARELAGGLACVVRDTQFAQGCLVIARRCVAEAKEREGLFLVVAIRGKGRGQRTPYGDGESRVVSRPQPSSAMVADPQARARIRLDISRAPASRDCRRLFALRTM